MTKRILALMLALLMMFSLAACGGDGGSDAGKASEPEATPYVCEHYWQEATCTAPETCYSCGETQGEPAPHSFGLWSFADPDMSHSCTVCGETETVALDYAVALKSYLEGQFNYFYQSIDGNVYDTYSGAPGSYLRFDADGNGVFRLPTTEGIDEIAISANSIAYDSETELFSFALVCEDGSTMGAMLGAMETGSHQMGIIVETGFELFVTKTPAEDKALAGTWASANDGELMIIELNEDGTISGNVGGELSGEWYSMPLFYNSYGQWNTGFNLLINENGTWTADGDTIWAGSSDMDPYEYLGYGLSSATVGLIFDDDWHTFAKVDDSRLEKLKTIHEENRTAIVNTWTTDSYSTYDSNSGETIETAGDFSITFNADGTFTSNMPNLEDGSWSYRGARINGGNIDCDYDTVFNGDDNYVTIYQDGNLGMSYYVDGEYCSFDLNTAEGLAAKAEAEAASIELIVGTWKGSQCWAYDTSKGDAQSVEISGSYSMTFNADGTVTAELETPYSGGTWSFYGYEETEYGNYYQYYVEGEDGSNMASVDEGGYLSFSNSPDDVVYYSYNLMK